jgi:hypothetical protein
MKNPYKLGLLTIIVNMLIFLFLTELLLALVKMASPNLPPNPPPPTQSQQKIKMPAYGRRTYTIKKEIGGVTFTGECEEKDGDEKTTVRTTWTCGYPCAQCGSLTLHAPWENNCEMFSIILPSTPTPPTPTTT